MNKYFVFILLSMLCFNFLKAQPYYLEIYKYRQEYINSLLTDKRQPITESDIKYIKFFAPDSLYRVTANITLTPGSKPFMVPTHSGKDKPFKEYGYITFSLNNTTLTLHVYQILNLINSHTLDTELFIPFNDFTNYDATFGGGRYIDLSINDIKDGKIIIDFNKCYNPYCAYKEGFSCPIPPEQNKLKFEIKAGEKQFEKYLSR